MFKEWQIRYDFEQMGGGRPNRRILRAKCKEDEDVINSGDYVIRPLKVIETFISRLVQLGLAVGIPFVLTFIIRPEIFAPLIKASVLAGISFGTLFILALFTPPPKSLTFSLDRLRNFLNQLVS